LSLYAHSSFDRSWAARTFSIRAAASEKEPLQVSVLEEPVKKATDARRDRKYPITKTTPRRPIGRVAPSPPFEQLAAAAIRRSPLAITIRAGRVVLTRFIPERWGRGMMWDRHSESRIRMQFSATVASELEWEAWATTRSVSVGFGISSLNSCAGTK
jgi:hypothetical protein